VRYDEFERFRTAVLALFQMNLQLAGRLGIAQVIPNPQRQP
jgi:hypothetical protein